MFLTQNEINRNIAWLLQHGSAPVQFLTRKHLLKTDPSTPEMQECWKSVQSSPAVQEIFSCQFEDGTWFSGGPWGPRGYKRQTGKGYTASRPKFVTTAWILPYLGEMGFTIADERIQRSCDAMLTEIHVPDISILKAPENQNCCGLSAIPLRAFASVGMGNDERLQQMWEWIKLCQRDDGGWLNPRHLPDSPNPSTTKGRWPWDRSCVWGSYFVAQALYYAGNDASALLNTCNFLLWHLEQKNQEHIQTWAYHGHNIIKELLMFSEAGVDMNHATIQTLLVWLRTYYRADDGVFRSLEKPTPNFVRRISMIAKQFEEQYGADYWNAVSKTGLNVLRYHLYHLIEDDWLTYTLTRIGMNLLNHS